MSEVISPYALTTLARVKDRIMDTNAGQTQPTSFDTVLTRMINSSSEWFERATGGRNFVLRTYTNEIYSSYSQKQKRVVTRNAPIVFITVTGDTTSGSNQILNVSSTTGMVIGMAVSGDNLAPTYTTGGNLLQNAITAISGSTITLGAACTVTATGAYFQVKGVMTFQWRAGTVTSPSWTYFIADQWDLVNDGRAGIIRLYGFAPSSQDNTMRITYAAGYAVDWANAGNNTTHQLPMAISDVVENLVVRRFKRRMLAGKGSEALEGATTSWNDEVDKQDKDTIDFYRRMPTIF